VLACLFNILVVEQGIASMMAAHTIYSELLGVASTGWSLLEQMKEIAVSN
jgi:hypothetical protein